MSVVLENFRVFVGYGWFYKLIGHVENIRPSVCTPL